MTPLQFIGIGKYDLFCMELFCMEQSSYGVWVCSVYHYSFMLMIKYPWSISALLNGSTILIAMLPVASRY